MSFNAIYLRHGITMPTACTNCVYSHALFQHLNTNVEDNPDAIHGICLHRNAMNRTLDKLPFPDWCPRVAYVKGLQETMQKVGVYEC